jgi:hypothetical protein
MVAERENRTQQRRPDLLHYDKKAIEINMIVLIGDKNRTT